MTRYHHCCDIELHLADLPHCCASGAVSSGRQATVVILQWLLRYSDIWAQSVSMKEIPEDGRGSTPIFERSYLDPKAATATPPTPQIVLNEPALQAIVSDDQSQGSETKTGLLNSQSIQFIKTSFSGHFPRVHVTYSKLGMRLLRDIRPCTYFVGINQLRLKEDDETDLEVHMCSKMSI